MNPELPELPENPENPENPEQPRFRTAITKMSEKNMAARFKECLERRMEALSFTPMFKIPYEQMKQLLLRDYDLSQDTTPVVFTAAAGTTGITRGMTERELQQAFLFVTRINYGSQCGNDPELCAASNLVLKEMRKYVPGEEVGSQEIVVDIA